MTNTTKELLFVLVQRSTKKVKRTTNIFEFEKSNKNKSCLRKILKSDGTIAVVPEAIMRELITPIFTKRIIVIHHHF